MLVPPRTLPPPGSAPQSRWFPLTLQSKQSDSRDCLGPSGP